MWACCFDGFLYTFDVQKIAPKCVSNKSQSNFRRMISFVQCVVQEIGFQGATPTTEANTKSNKWMKIPNFQEFLVFALQLTRTQVREKLYEE